MTRRRHPPLQTIEVPQPTTRHFENSPSERKQQTAAHRTYAAVDDVCVVCGRETIDMAAVRSSKARHVRSVGIQSQRVTYAGTAYSKGMLQTSVVHLLCAESVINIISHCCKEGPTPSQEKRKSRRYPRMFYVASSKRGEDVLLMMC